MDAKPGASAPAVTPSNLEAYNLWIHCNRCCEQYVRKNSNFFMLACHHVTCDKCVQVCVGRSPSDAPVYKCPVCHNNVRGRQVNNTMPNNFKQFFHPEPFGQSNEFIETFQMTNHRHFVRFKEKKGKKTLKLTKDVELIKFICQKRYIGLEAMRVERKKLSARLREIKVQVAKRQEEMEKEKRMAAERQHRSQAQPKAGSGHGQSKPASPSTFSTTSSSSSQKRKQVTCFRHHPNYSFNL